MNLEEYRKSVHEDMAIAAEVNISYPADEFLSYATDILISGDEFDDFIPCYYEGITHRNGLMKINGYSIDESDGSCCVFVLDYKGPFESSSIIGEDIKNAFKRARFFVEEAIKYRLYSELEESTEAYEFAYALYNNNEQISKYRFYLITDAFNKQRTKNIKDETLNGKTVELNVWDIERLYNIVNSVTQKESIEILLDDFGVEGIPCVKGTECVNVKADIEVPILYDGDKEPLKPQNIITYSSYLAVVPGQVLCDLYLEYGSRLLEGNVRSFLSVKGKVNKNIQNTIKNYPDMFFAYNNGIAATATELDTEMTYDGLKITRIKDLQIVNGGQTTASIANTVLTAKKYEKIDLSNLKVPMKISVLDHDIAEKIIPKISEYSNSQNKVDASDFFSNHPFHIRMEDYSRKTPAPAINGNQFQQYWYYERTRGQYNQGKMKLTKKELNQYKIKYPDNQVIKLVDLAKYMEIYAGAPDIVSKGKQAIVREFASSIKEQWEKSKDQFNVVYFKRVVAIAIMFKNTDNIIKSSNEYKYGNKNSYKANVIAYTLSILFDYVEKNYKSKSIDFSRIWANQKIYPELEAQIKLLWPAVYEFITNEDRPMQNVTEWCKKSDCWKKARQETWNILPTFINTLVSKDELKNEEKEAKYDRKLEDEVECFKFILQSGSEYWKNLLEWGNSRKLLYHEEQDILRKIIQIDNTGIMPSYKEAKKIIKTRERLIKEGMPLYF